MSKLVEPTSVTRLKHPATMALPSASSRFLLAASVTGEVSIISEAGIREVSLRRRVYSTSPTIDDEGKHLGFIELHTSRLVIRNLETGREAQVEPDIEFQDCCFDEDGHLWTIYILGEDFVLEQREARFGLAKRKTKFKRPSQRYNGGRLWPGGAPGRVIIRTFRGQSYLGIFDAATGQVSARHLEKLEGDLFPVITSVSGELICLDHGSSQIIRMAWPYEEILGQAAWPIFDENMSSYERPGHSACYLDLVHVLVVSAEGRLLVLHTRSMEFVEEIHVQGVEPFSLRDTDHPRTVEGRPMVSYLKKCGRFGDSIAVFFEAENGDMGGRLVIIPISEFL